MPNTFEVNFDGLVGLTHHYAGLADGNLASMANAKSPADPKSAAKQGLAKMKTLLELGLHQGIIPPQERPNIAMLKQLGFTGNHAQILAKAYKQAPELLTACSSASSMWAANAATVSPSADCLDSKVHFTPANLTSHFHRAQEVNTTSVLLQTIFNNEQHFVHHCALPACRYFADEGAANHTRLCGNYGDLGVEIFTYGDNLTSSSTASSSARFNARQSLAAGQVIARNHQLNPARTLFVQQNPAAINQGVFHNDVIGVGNQNVLFYHTQAFVDTERFLAQLSRSFTEKLVLIEVTPEQVSIEEAVASYLFNSQLVTLANGDMALILPQHCQTNAGVNTYLQELLSQSTPIKQCLFIDVNQSMKNGGGPACLRLRVVLTETELQAVNQSCLLTDALYQKLSVWIDKHYREQLTLHDLQDVQLLDECQTALDELTQLLNLGSVYPFQQA